jgi:anti-sigma B factor antagonist
MTLIDPGQPQAVVVSDGTGLRVELSGDLDLAVRGQLDDVVEKVAAAPAGPVVVDLTAVTFMGSDALGFLARLRRHVTTAGFEVTLVGPNRVALRALQVSGFDRVFTIDPGADQG